MTTIALRRGCASPSAHRHHRGGGWLAAWFANLPLANWAAYDFLGLERGSHVGDAGRLLPLHVPKVLLLLLAS